MKNFMKFVFLLVCVAALGFLGWKLLLSRDAQYSRPLAVLVQNTFHPKKEQDPNQNITRIESALQRSRQRLSSNAGTPRVDQATIGLCNTLLGVYAEKSKTRGKLAAAASKTYPSLGAGPTPEQKRKQFMDSLKRQQKTFDREAEDHCKRLMRQIRSTK